MRGEAGCPPWKTMMMQMHSKASRYSLKKVATGREETMMAQVVCTCGLGETHARAVHSWRTALCGINPCWSSSWRTAAHEKDPYWSSSWRTASFGKNHAGECNRMREKQQQRQHHRLTVTPFNIPLHCLGWGTRWKSGVKKSLERGRGGEKLCLFLIFCFIFYFSLLFLTIALMLIDNKLIFSKLGLEEILTLI